MYENSQEALKDQAQIRKRLLNQLIDYNIDAKAIAKESKIGYLTLLKFIRGKNVSPLILLRLDRYLNDFICNMQND